MISDVTSTSSASPQLPFYTIDDEPVWHSTQASSYPSISDALFSDLESKFLLPEKLELELELSSPEFPYEDSPIFSHDDAEDSGIAASNSPTTASNTYSYNIMGGDHYTYSSRESSLSALSPSHSSTTSVEEPSGSGSTGGPGNRRKRSRSRSSYEQEREREEPLAKRTRSASRMTASAQLLQPQDGESDGVSGGGVIAESRLPNTSGLGSEADGCTCDYMNPVSQRKCLASIGRPSDLWRHQAKHRREEQIQVMKGLLKEDGMTRFTAKVCELAEQKHTCTRCGTEYSRRDAFQRHLKGGRCESRMKK